MDRAHAQSTAFTADFQDLITRYAWGEIWTRPGLDVRTRRILVLGTLVALGRLDELAMHARAAVASGDIDLPALREVLLQQAIYCGVPAANAAFHAVERALETSVGDACHGPVTSTAGGADPA